MTDVDRIAYLLIALAILDWTFTSLLVLGARRMNEPALTERAITSVILSVAATCIAFIAALFLLRVIDGLAQLRFGLLLFSVIAISIPQLIWGTLFLTGRFR